MIAPKEKVPPNLRNKKIVGICLIHAQTIRKKYGPVKGIAFKDCLLHPDLRDTEST